MGLLHTFSILFAFTALFSYVNHRYIRLPQTIGLLIASLIISVSLIAIAWLFPGAGLFTGPIASLNGLSGVFSEALLQGMLGFLLFAGALHINLNDLVKQRAIIAILATFGVVVSTFLIGLSSYYLFNFLGFEIGFLYCLIFGAIISPTDPIAVLGILKMVKAPKSLETKIAGESLFNDGVGVVVFAVLLAIAKAGGWEMYMQHHGYTDILIHFVLEAAGGVALGLALGSGVYLLLRSVDDYPLEIMLTLALVLGGSSIAGLLHVSGPLAMVVAGLLIGNRGRLYAMSEKTNSQLFSFWELIDDFLNAILFFVIGFILIGINLELSYIGLGLIAIPLVLIIRLGCIAAPVKALSQWFEFSNGAISVMTWGGLRGGISIALALSLPRDVEIVPLIQTITYVVVVFSIVVQGLTIGPLIKRTL